MREGLLLDAFIVKWLFLKNLINKKVGLFSIGEFKVIFLGPTYDLKITMIYIEESFKL